MQKFDRRQVAGGNDGLRIEAADKNQRGQRQHRVPLANPDFERDGRGILRAGEDQEVGIDDGNAVEGRRRDDRDTDVGIGCNDAVHQ